jgi:hypothetical protein
MHRQAQALLSTLGFANTDGIGEDFTDFEDEEGSGFAGH